MNEYGLGITIGFIMVMLKLLVKIEEIVEYGQSGTDGRKILLVKMKASNE